MTATSQQGNKKNMTRFLQVITKRQWFSGKIHRCHRWAPRSIRGWRMQKRPFQDASFFLLFLRESPFLCLNPCEILGTVHRPTGVDAISRTL